MSIIVKRMIDTVIRQIGIRVGRNTFSVSYRDYAKDVTGIEIMVLFDGKDYVPAIIAQESQDSKEIYGWEAAKKSETLPKKQVKKDFAENLLSKEESVYQEACLLTEKFMGYLKQQSDIALEQEGDITVEELTTVITYPTGFGKREQEAIRKAAEKAGFENIVLVHEVEAAVRYEFMYETGKMEDILEQKKRGLLRILFADLNGGQKKLSFFVYDSVYREMLERVLRNYQYQTEKPEEELLAQIKQKKSGADIVILSGNQKECEWIKEQLQNEFAEERILTFPQETGELAKGAALVEADLQNLLWEDGIFFNGLTAIKKEEKWSCVNVRGETLSESEWDEFEDLRKDEGMVYDKTIGYYMDIGGGSLLAEGDWEEMRRFSEDIAVVRKGRKWGYIDRYGRMISTYQWDEAESFKDGLAKVGLGKYHYKYNHVFDIKYSYINKEGKVADYDYVGEFKEGLTKVGKAGKYGYIDKAGKVVIECQWEYAGEFNDGLAKVKYYKEDSQYGYIDKTGEVVRWYN